MEVPCVFSDGHRLQRREPFQRDVEQQILPAAMESSRPPRRLVKKRVPLLRADFVPGERSVWRSDLVEAADVFGDVLSDAERHVVRQALRTPHPEFRKTLAQPARHVRNAGAGTITSNVVLLGRVLRQDADVVGVQREVEAATGRGFLDLFVINAMFVNRRRGEILPPPLSTDVASFAPVRQVLDR